MSAAFGVARNVAKVVAPELEVPIELGVRAAGAIARGVHRDLGGGPVAVVPPAGNEPIVKFGRDRIRVRTRRGIRVVSIDRAKGLTVGELIGLAALAGVAYAAYVANQDLAKYTGGSSSSSSPPLSGYGGYLPGATGWGNIKW